jgi:hypothetical protein
MQRTKSVGGVWRLTLCVLAVLIPIETAYSWRLGLAEPYYLVKVVGWGLLAWGAAHVRGPRSNAGLAFLAAGWAWQAANYWRAVADRVTRLADGDALRLGSLELWFAGSCLLVSLAGLVWSLSLTSTSGRAEHH